MDKKNFLILLLCFGCGANVKVDNSKLLSFSNVTSPTSTSLVAKAGALKRGNGTIKDAIIYNNTSYTVSMYSSYAALEYISARPLNYQGNVTFKGTITGNEILLEDLTN